MTQAMLDQCQMVLGIELASDRNQLSTSSSVRTGVFPNAEGEISASQAMAIAAEHGH